jgi:hypothetical protein
MHQVKKFRRELVRQLRPLLPIAALFGAVTLAHVLGF